MVLWARFECAAKGGGDSNSTVVNADAVSVSPAQVVPGEKATVSLHLPFLANAGAAYLHYGFNGWNFPFSGATAGSDSQEGNTNFFKQVPMTFNPASSAYEVQVDVPTSARALHFAVCRDACGAGQWDDNNGQDYSWPVVFPYIGPVLSWTEAVTPESGMVVSFMTSIDAASWLKFGAANDPSGQLMRDGGGERHVFTLQGLTPATTYWYEVGSEGGLTSARYEFSTAKPKAEISRLSFAVYSDAQDNGETGSFSQTVQELVRNQSDLDFLLVSGDMPWNDHPGDWWVYFDKARELLATKVVMPVLGNHDTPTVDSNLDQTSFQRLFTLPKPGPHGFYYSFDFGPARFFALDSERMLDFGSPNGEQYTWLRGEIATRRAEIAASATPLWTFTYWHIPPFDGGVRHWSQQFDYRAPIRLFNGVIDWDFSAHEHLGQRMAPMNVAGSSPAVVSAYGIRPGAGTGFLVTPAAGAVPEGQLLENAASNGNIRDLVAYPAKDAANPIAPFNGFERVDIDGDQIHLRMFGASRSRDDAVRGFYVRDEIQYSK